ncbi:NAD(P)H-quinone oxidoreductase subunit 2, chloroplastic [Streptomyces alboniger]
MYAAVNLGAFAVAALVGRTKTLNRISDYRGLYASNPLAALLLAFCLAWPDCRPASSASSPRSPSSPQPSTRRPLLAVVMAVNVVIALFYYLQWTTLLFRAPEGEPHRPTACPLPSTAALALTGVLGRRPLRRTPVGAALHRCGPLLNPALLQSTLLNAPLLKPAVVPPVPEPEPAT